MRSAKSRLSQIATNLTSRSKKARLAPAPLPVSDLDKGIVGWESQDDPEMPLNFPEKRKWMLIALLGAITFISPLASSMFAPGVMFMNETFHNTSTILSALTVSIFVLGKSHTFLMFVWNFVGGATPNFMFDARLSLVFFGNLYPQREEMIIS